MEGYSSPFRGAADNAMGTQRRSSSRSIRRKKFDDELVEYSTRPVDANIAPVPGSSKTMRVRAHSVPSTSIDASAAALPHHTSSGRKSSSRSKGKSRAVKDLGRWKPTDDLALINAVTQTCDIRTVERGVKFSCRFTYSEISQRWHALLYDPVVSRVAMAAIQNLHPDMVAAVQNKALYSVAEEELLSNVKSVNTDPAVFDDLLAKHPQVFYHTRTAKSLFAHWTMMRQYNLLKDQVFLELDSCTFSDEEERPSDTQKPEPRDEALEVEIQLADRRSKREIRNLEEEISRLQVVVDGVSGPGHAPQSNGGMDPQAVAVLKGRYVRYIIKNNEVTIGRNTKTQRVDIDLGAEAYGRPMKVSRRQGTIRMRDTGDFFICNEGKRPIFVNGRPVLHGYKQHLTHDSVVEIAGLQFMFSINTTLLDCVREKARKWNMPP